MMVEANIIFFPWKIFDSKKGIHFVRDIACDS